MKPVQIYRPTSLVLALNAAINILIVSYQPLSLHAVTKACIAAGLAGLFVVALSGAATWTPNEWINRALAGFLFVIFIPWQTQNTIEAWTAIEQKPIGVVITIVLVLLVAATLGMSSYESSRHAAQDTEEKS